MAGTAPDDTATYDTTSPAASDAALKTLLGTALGKDLRVGSEHWLAKAAAETTLCHQSSGSDSLFKWFGVEWLMGRVIDITDLADDKAW